MLALALADKDDKISVRQIGAITNLSDSYLEQIIALLKKAGLVSSIRGNKGGYKLSRSASDISAGDILRAAEGSLSPVRCTDEANDECVNQDQCLTKIVWHRLEKSISKAVDNITLDELAKKYKADGYDETNNFII